MRIYKVLMEDARQGAVCPGSFLPMLIIGGKCSCLDSGSLLVKLFAFPISRYFADETILSIAITVHGEHADGGGEIGSPSSLVKRDVVK